TCLVLAGGIPQLRSEPQSRHPPAARMVPPQTGHSAGPPAARSSQAPRTTSSSVDPAGSNSLIAERSVCSLMACVAKQSEDAGRDLADQRQPVGLDRFLRLVDEQLDRARLGGVAAQEAGLLQIRQMGVNGRGGVQADGLADLTNGRRVAVFAGVLADEIEDLF